MVTFKSNGMPLVHHSRNLRAIYTDGNLFCTMSVMKAHLDAMEDRYLNPKTSDKVCRALHVEMDLLAEICG